jgi:hypothetical protein
MDYVLLGRVRMLPVEHCIDGIEASTDGRSLNLSILVDKCTGVFSVVILDVFVATYLNQFRHSDHHRLRFYALQLGVFSGYFEEFWHFANLTFSFKSLRK